MALTSLRLASASFFTSHEIASIPLPFLLDEQGGHPPGRRRLHPSAQEARRRERRRRGSRKCATGSLALSRIILRKFELRNSQIEFEFES